MANCLFKYRIWKNELNLRANKGPKITEFVIPAFYKPGAFQFENHFDQYENE